MKPILLLTTLSSLSVSGGAYASTKAQPNIVIIFTDDHRYDGISALGNRDLKTPNFDSLVERGVTFTNTYLQGANSAATSTPSRAQLLTGRSVFEIEMTWRNFPAKYTSFAAAFSEAGYNTFTTGKQNNAESSMRGFTSGAKLFDLSPAYYNPHFYLPVQDYRADGKYNIKHLYLVGGENQEFRVPPAYFYANKKKGETEPRLKLEEFDGTHSSEVFATATADYITTYSDEKPFLIYLPFHAPHDPRNAPQKYYDMYPPESLQLPANYAEKHPFDTGDMEARDELIITYPRKEAEVRKELSDYYALITHLDDQLGVVLKAIEDKGIADNTLVVFASDSGLGMGSHALMGKQNLYDDAGIHVPFVLCGLDIPKNERRTNLCYTYDIYPTLCDIAGVKIPESVTGKSVKGAIAAPNAAAGREELFFGYKNIQRAIRDEQYKLIEFCVNGERNTLLFDIKNDPYETKDLSKDRSYRKVLKHMRERLVANKSIDAEWGAKFWETYLK
ncbi:MAG: sulfatase-like hydrolase/transferase [Rikenellaceae bacterium]